MIRKPIKKSTRLLLGCSAFILLFVGYLTLSHFQHLENPSDTTMPGLSQLSEGFKDLIKERPNLLNSNAALPWHGDRWFMVDAIATGKRLLAGLTVGIGLAVILGILMGCFTPIAAFLNPPISFFAKIPPTAMLAVYFVLFGTGFTFFSAMVALGILPALTLAIHTAVEKDVQMNSINKAYTIGASHSEVVWNVVVRQILPRILQNIELAIGPAMVFLIAAEWLAADVGFGYRLRMQQRLLNMNVVYIYLIFLGSAGFFIDYGLKQLRRKLCPWFGE